MDFATARVKMVDNQIRTTDVTSHELLRAFLSVPREAFVPDERKALAYIDEDIPVGHGRFLVEPSPLAKLIQMAQPDRGDVVLDVGCTTGYSTAILSHLTGTVVGLEENADLADKASELMAQMGFHSTAIANGSLNQGYPKDAPFNIIIFQGAVDEVPEIFFDQLAERGRLVAVEGRGLSGMAKLYTKEDGIISDRFGFNCSLKPLPGFERKQSFVF